MKEILPEWYYLIVAIPFGIAFLFVTPPSQVPDEYSHLLRAYQLSEGRLLPVKEGGSTGGNLPVALKDMMSPYWRIAFYSDRRTSFASLLETRKVRLDPAKRELMFFPNTAVYPPLTYVPQAAALFIGRQFTSSALILLYLARAANLFAAAYVMFQAIRRTPVAKWIFTILALTPMAMFEAASLSSDALTNSLSFLIVSQALLLAFGPEDRIPFSSLMTMAVMGIAIGQCKPGYFLIPASYLLIPVARMGNRAQYWRGFAIVMGATALSVLAWSLFVRGTYSPANPDPNAGIDAQRQLRLIFSEPEAFFTALEVTLAQTPNYIRQFTGVLGFLDTSLPFWILVIEWLIMLIVLVDNAAPRDLINRKQAFLSLAIAYLEISMITVAIYLTWERVGATTVIGIQGRYFIPLSPLVALALTRLLRGLHRPCARLMPFAHHLAVATVPSVLLVTLYTLLTRYYGAES